MPKVTTFRDWFEKGFKNFVDAGLDDEKAYDVMLRLGSVVDVARRNPVAFRKALETYKDRWPADLIDHLRRLAPRQNESRALN